MTSIPTTSPEAAAAAAKLNFDNNVVQRQSIYYSSRIARQSTTTDDDDDNQKKKKPIIRSVTGGPTSGSRFKRLLTNAVSSSFSYSRANSQPPRLLRASPLFIRVYYINQQWKSVISKLCIICYMSVIFWILFRETTPWYEFFYYLTLQGWTLEIIYFVYSVYLDLLARWYGDVQSVSRVSKAAAQALSELVFALQVVIVMFFWLVIYPQEPKRNILWELNTHGMGLLLMIGDYLYRFTGFSLRNHRYVLAFALNYSSMYMYIVVYLNKSIYPGIDFRSVKSVVIFLAGLSTVVVTHKVVYLISNWKWIKQDVKSIIGVAKVIFLRQSSADMFTHSLAE